MDGEQPHRQRGTQNKPPGVCSPRSGPAPQQKGLGQQEQDDGIDRIEDQADEVVPPGIQPEEDVLGFENHPRQGLVDPDLEAGQGPADLGPAQTTVERVLEEVLGIIPGNERVTDAGTESSDDQQDGDRYEVPCSHRGGRRRVGLGPQLSGAGSCHGAVLFFATKEM